MQTQNSAPSWMDDPSLKDIPRQKLDFLQKLVFESKNLSQKELLPFLMALAQRSRDAQISFSPDEMNAIITAIKAVSTPDEINKMNQLMRLMSKK